MMEKLYVLCGKARNGKDTVMEFIRDYYRDKRVINLSYGAYPKTYVKLITDWNGLDETKPRDILNDVGMRAREINPNYMVRRMEEDINILKDYFDVMIISDARMVAEMDMPKKFKETVTVKVIRTNFVSPLSENEKHHILENSLDDYECDYVIYNDGSLNDLKLKVKKMIEGGD